MATLEQLYQQVLGRAPDPGGYQYWSQEFGPTIEPNEVSTFLSGIVGGQDLANKALAEQRAQSFISSLSAPPPPVYTPPPAAPPPPATPTVNTDRAFAENLVRQTFQTVLGRQPLQEGLNYWVNEIMSGRSDPSNIALNVYYGAQEGDKAAAEQWRQRTVGDLGGSLESTPLETTGETKIDPAIAPYLTEALGVARNLFLKGPGPSMYPGQTYVSPSAATLDALAAAETLGRSPTATGLGADVLSAYSGGLSTLSDLASPDYMESQAYKDYVSSVTRPVTEAVTEQILPAIASQYSAAGRYGSGAMAGATGMATERGARAVGDITSQIAQQERQNQLSALGYMPSFLGGLSGVVGGALAPSGILAGVGAQREAISGQPLQEAIRRYEYTQNLPYNQLSGYLSSIYGSPLGNLAQPNVQGNTTLQNLGALVGIGAGVGQISETPFGSFLGGMFT